MKTIGIDFSMNSPAVCSHDGADWSYDNCTFFFMTKKISHIKNMNQTKFLGRLFDTYESDTERFLQNANAIRDWIRPTKNVHIAVEGYAFGVGNSSRLLQIGEATGILKTLLIYDHGGKIINGGGNTISLAPTTIKKFATGSGRADKEIMFAQFLKDTGDNLLNTFKMKRLGNPVHDLVDAYWLSKYHFNQIQATN